jgi:phytoene synthase
MPDDVYAHCQALVRASDKDRFVAGLFAPADRRQHLFALYAFNLEIARIAEVAHEPLSGEVRLQWWYDALTGVADKEFIGHPVAGALVDTLDRYRLSAQPLLDLIEARRFDLYQEPMASLADLETYVRRTSCGLFAMAARVLVWDEREVVGVAEAAGLAYGTAVLADAVHAHASRGRIYLPIDVLDRHGASAEDLRAGRVTSGLRAAVGELTSRARQHFDEFRQRAERLPPAALPAFLPVAVVPLTIRRAARSRPRERSSAGLAPLGRLIAILAAGWLGFARS